MRIIRLLAILPLVLASAFARAQTEITVYTYDDRAPFVLDKAKGEGLEYRLCRWLTRASGQYRFTLKVVTAPEAKALAAREDFQGVLLGVNRAWFPEAVQKGCLWTAPILWDRELVVSRGSHKVEYQGPASLAGLRIAGVKGFFYPGVTGDVAKGRVDFATEVQALKAVAEGAADVAIVSEWTLTYEQLRDGFEADVYQANRNFLEFERCILVPRSLPALKEHLDRLLADVRKNPGWQEATSL